MKYKVKFLIYALLLFVESFLVIYSLYTFNELLNTIIASVFNINTLILWIGISLGFVALNFVTSYLRNDLKYLINYNLRNKKIQNLATNRFNSSILDSSEKNKMINNIDSIIEHVIFGVLDLLIILFITGLGLGLLFYYHWILGLVSILSIVVALFASIVTSQLGSKYQINMINETNNYNSQIEKIVDKRNKYYLINKMAFFNKFILKFTLSKNSLVYKNFKKSTYIIIPAIFFSFLVQVVVPISGSLLISDGQISLSVLAIGSFIAGIVSVNIFQLPSTIQNLISWNKVKRSFWEENINQGSFKPKEISLKNFNPLRNSKSLFKQDISLNITKKSKIHITGENGIGKSSLINALKLNKDYQGTFKPQRELINAPNIVFLSETPYVLTGTLFSNLQLVNEKITHEQALEIMKQVNLKVELDKNISSETLSSGQKQKIALAKVLIKKPEFVFIDEGMNNISSKDRMSIQRELLKEKCGIVLISHKGVIDGYQTIKII